jgi:RecA/RadA recombinase
MLLNAGTEVATTITAYVGSVGGVIVAIVTAYVKIEAVLRRRREAAVEKECGPMSSDEPDTRKRPLTGPELDVLREDRLRAEAERLRDLAEQQGRTIEALKDSLGHSRVRMAEQEARIADLEARLKDQGEIDADIRRMTAAVATAELAGKRHDQRAGYTSLPSLPPAAITVPPALPPMPVRVVEIDGRTEKPTPQQGTRRK